MSEFACYARTFVWTCYVWRVNIDLGSGLDLIFDFLSTIVITKYSLTCGIFGSSLLVVLWSDGERDLAQSIMVVCKFACSILVMKRIVEWKRLYELMMSNNLTEMRLHFFLVCNCDIKFQAYAYQQRFQFLWMSLLCLLCAVPTGHMEDYMVYRKMFFVERKSHPCILSVPLWLAWLNKSVPRHALESRMPSA